ncbi:hypothetical protein [Pseudoclavibacter helvolus]|uniref:hypothetical protein n=1 Tax=Pseudoclavibacter helvolus TaxID=255205 RepID=UPI00083938AE|nr:hypothetical protein [Pseudoclavibacter helvolus]
MSIAYLAYEASSSSHVPDMGAVTIAVIATGIAAFSVPSVNVVAALVLLVVGMLVILWRFALTLGGAAAAQAVVEHRRSTRVAMQALTGTRGHPQVGPSRAARAATTAAVVAGAALLLGSLLRQRSR